MRILFDKNVPYPLRRYLETHEVRTAAEQGWDRLVNGELLMAIGILEGHPEKLIAAVNAVAEGGYKFVTYELPPKPKAGPRGPSI